MRVVITDSDVRAGRQLAACLDRMHPQADVLLYTDDTTALEGISQHKPDVVFVAPAVGTVDGPQFVSRLTGDREPDATIVGIVDTPDAEWSTRYVDAGATVVVSRPVDELGIRVALRQRADGIPG
jgi:DNA-binding response OmpR family regulator